MSAAREVVSSSSPAASAHLIGVHYEQSSLKLVQLRWLVKREGEATGKSMMVEVSIVDEIEAPKCSKEWLCRKEVHENEQDSYDIPSHLLIPGHTYNFVVKLMSPDDSNSTEQDSMGLMQVLSTRAVNFRLGYSKEEMAKLLTKAMGHVSKNGKWLPCSVFYRDKEPEYYDYCMYNCNGWMLTSLKNDNGDPASPINGTIKGIFLGVNVDRNTGYLPTTSIFGCQRFHVPISYVYGSDFNLYFADFYCHTGSKGHHLVLVLTKERSGVDKFCKRCLPQLNKMRNPFLFQDPLSGQMMHTINVWIDIYFTEPIAIDRRRFVMVSCSNTILKMGKPKNQSCPVCNIYH